MEQIIQGTAEWHAARRGKVTASRIADVMARTKTGPAASRANYAAELVVERLTGTTADRFVSAEMQWGIDNEADARASYEFLHGVDVTQTGFVSHPTISMTGASPDGLVGDDGLIEIKCPNTNTHINTLLGEALPAKYISQMQWQMACTGRLWCDFVSYDPRMPLEMRLFVKRVARDAAHIAEIEKEIGQFLSEVEDRISRLTSIYARPAEPELAEKAEEEQLSQPKEKSAAQQIAIACGNPLFWEYVRLKEQQTLPDEKEAFEAWVKAFLDVERKRDVTPGTEAFAKWTEFYGTFHVWLRYEREAT